MLQIPNAENAHEEARKALPGAAALADEEKRRLDLETERAARKQAEVGQIVRGDRG